MDSTPPSSYHDRSDPPRTQTKSSVSRLSKLRHCSEQGGGSLIPQQLSLDLVPSSPRISTPSPASTVSPRPPYTLPLQELLMLSPSPVKRSKARLDLADDAAVEASGARKRCKTRNSGSTCAASPRGGRRSRRRLEQEAREEREFAAAGGEVLVKAKKKRHGERSRASKSIPTPPVPSPRTDEGEGCNLDALGEAIHDLIMWKDVSKSSLWFGLGSLSFLSSCFVKGVNYSIFSFISQVGLLLLALSFLSNLMRQREGTENSNKPNFKLKEEDILRVGRLMLPFINLAITKAREIFSGEPAMTLKVVPVFLLGAEYGHFITLWRLCALGFFISFTGPKLYSTYSCHLSKKVEYLKTWARNAWESCTHKKIVAGSAVTAFWNLTSLRTRIFAAFLCLVILRYRRQHLETIPAVGEEDNNKNKNNNNTSELKQEEEMALVAVSKK